MTDSGQEKRGACSNHPSVMHKIVILLRYFFVLQERSFGFPQLKIARVASIQMNVTEVDHFDQYTLRYRDLLANVFAPTRFYSSLDFSLGSLALTQVEIGMDYDYDRSCQFRLFQLARSLYFNKRFLSYLVSYQVL